MTPWPYARRVLITSIGKPKLGTRRAAGYWMLEHVRRAINYGPWISSSMYDARISRSSDPVGRNDPWLLWDRRADGGTDEYAIRNAWAMFQQELKETGQPTLNNELVYLYPSEQLPAGELKIKVFGTTHENSVLDKALRAVKTKEMAIPRPRRIEIGVGPSSMAKGGTRPWTPGKMSQKKRQSIKEWFADELTEEEQEKALKNLPTILKYIEKWAGGAGSKSAWYATCCPTK